MSNDFGIFFGQLLVAVAGYGLSFLALVLAFAALRIVLKRDSAATGQEVGAMLGLFVVSAIAAAITAGIIKALG